MATVTYFPDHESSDEVAATKRLTSRDIASAWGLALFGLAGLVVFSLAVDSTLVSSGQDSFSCWRAAMDIARPH